MWTVQFWKQATERAIKTVAQTALAMWSASTFDLLAADLLGTLGVALGAGVLSILTSLASAGVKHDDSPSLV